MEGIKKLEELMQRADEAFTQIKVFSKENNGPVSIKGKWSGLHCIGIGTDAAVFQFETFPLYAFKRFAEDKHEKYEMEIKVYSHLNNSAYFPTFYGAKNQYLILSYEPGVTLYECLVRGIHIPRGVIYDVEEARSFVRKQGLNPRDIHLKNIILHEGKAKLLDVSEYLKPDNDLRWESLRKGYEELYDLIDGKEIPIWMIETVKKWYDQYQYTASFDIHEFLNKIKKIFKVDTGQR